MADVTISPNMNLPVPVTGVDSGPDWANNLNSCFSIVDQHNHSSGSGVQITPAGLNINSDLAINGNNLTLIRSVRFSPQLSALSLPADVGCLYEAGVDLYYNDGAGNQIRITQSGSVSGSTGTITGLPSGTASASYGGGTFVFQSATSTSAVIDGGSFILRNNTASSKGLTLSPPNAMGANYGLTLPSIPGSQSFLTLDASGNIADYASISQGLTGSNIVSNVNLLGKAVQENGNNVIVSNTNATNSLAAIRGAVDSAANILAGEGFTVISTSTGQYTITFSSAFSSSDFPVVTASLSLQGGFPSGSASVSYDIFPYQGVHIGTFNSSGALVNSGFSFIAIGQRA